MPGTLKTEFPSPPDGYAPPVRLNREVQIPRAGQRWPVDQHHRSAVSTSVSHFARHSLSVSQVLSVARKHVQGDMASAAVQVLREKFVSAYPTVSRWKIALLPAFDKCSLRTSFKYHRSSARRAQSGSDQRPCESIAMAHCYGSTCRLCAGGHGHTPFDCRRRLGLTGHGLGRAQH